MNERWKKKEMALALLDDEMWFVGKPDVIDVPENSVYCKTKRSHKKRGYRSFACEWCERYCEDLVHDVGCTNECALSYLFNNNIAKFNLVFIAMGKSRPYVDTRVYPKILPPKPAECTTEAYWCRWASKIYSIDDVRYTPFIARLRETAEEDFPAKLNRRDGI